MLVPKVSLLTEIAGFKKACRRVAADCIHESQEWVFDTCKSRANRLGIAGIANKHAAICGMPTLDEEEKRITMQILLELRGKGSRKQVELHEKGKLMVKKTPFTYGRFAVAIEAKSGTLECRTNAFAASIQDKASSHLRPFLHVHCPSCQFPRSSKGLNLNMVTNHAKLKRQSCKETVNTKNWACNCGEKCRKCPVHELTDFHPKVSPRKRPRIQDARGVDKPPPKSRRLEVETVAALSGVYSRGAIALPPNGKLAARFPHLVKAVATDLRVATG